MENNENNEKEMIDLLEKIFSNVNNWLTFAEAKNAAIIAFNIAVISALFSGKDILGETFLFYLVNVITIISSGFALAAFMPDMGDDRRTVGEITEPGNLLLYGNIAKYTKEKYLIALYMKYFDSEKQENNLSKLELDYAGEITYNAGITVKKYKRFRCALCVDFAGILGILMLVILA